MFHVVTGGSGSGKSAFAEQCILDCQGNKRIYIATMYPFDEESHRRIARHRAMRAEKKFTTIERYTDLEHLTIPQGADVLLECMSNLTANEIYQEGGAGDNTVKAILNGIHHLLEQAGNLVVVTNEVFSDGITYDPETEKYLEKLGAINCQMAQIADTVTEVVYGIPIFHKKTGEERKMKKFYHSFLIAFSMYSKIPMPQCEWNEENMAYAMCFFPWIGVAIGGVTWLWGTFGTYLGLSSAFYTVILTLIPWFLTGGIHLDGLLDTADAMSSWQERERRLEILKDSNSGAFAVITCAVYFMFYYGVYSQISARALAMIPFTFCLSRTLSGLAIVTFPKAKKTGSVSAMARGAKDRQVKATMCVYLLILLAGMLLVDWKLGLLVYGVAILVYALYYRNAMKYFGGTTGDLAGCFLSLCEVFMACGAVLGALWL